MTGRIRRAELDAGALRAALGALGYRVPDDLAARGVRFDGEAGTVTLMVESETFDPLRDAGDPGRLWEPEPRPAAKPPESKPKKAWLPGGAAPSATGEAGE